MKKQSTKSTDTRSNPRTTHGQESRMSGRMSRSRSSRNEEEMEDNNQDETQGQLLETFFLNELKDIYWAEKHLVKALTKLAKNATSAELQNAFEDHRRQTEVHMQRLEEVFEMLDEKAKAKKCEAITGITDEAESIIDETEDDTYTRDVALIMAGQKAEHYEIATYGGLVTIARTLGKAQEVIDLLEETLEEEKEADRL